MHKEIYQLPNLKDIASIEKFKLAPEQIKQLYPRAFALPEFFIRNLVSPLRVVKCFTGKFALVQAFYFQLMKLAMEIEVEGRNYRDIIFNKFVRYEFFGEGELQDQIFSDYQYRKFMKDFIQKVQQQNIPNFQKTAQKYPIIEEILYKIFSLFVPYPLIICIHNSKQPSKQIAREILTFLASQFSITLKEMDQCFKLEESDMFVYIESIDEVYLAFNDEQLQVEDQSSFVSTIQCGQGNSFVTKYHSTNNKISQLKSTNKNELYTKDWKQILLERTQQYKLQDLQPLRMQVSSKPNNFCKSNKTAKEPNKYQKQISQNIALTGFKSAHLNPTQRKTYAHKQNSQQYYKQFTSSFILDQLPQHNKQEIKNIKNKYTRKRQSVGTFFLH